VPDRRHRRGQGAAPDRLPAGVTGALDGGLPQRALSFWNGAGPAVDDQSGSSRGLTQ